jgi:hypothetical protein
MAHSQVVAMSAIATPIEIKTGDTEGNLERLKYMALATTQTTNATAMKARVATGLRAANNLREYRKESTQGTQAMKVMTMGVTSVKIYGLCGVKVPGLVQ